MSATLLISGLEFDALPYEEGRRWELLEGELIAVSSATPRHQKIVFRINLILTRYFASRYPAGAEVLADVEFALSPDTRLRPDVCVLLAHKASRLDPDRIPIPGAPDIAIEVISPTERPSESLEKVRAYLRHGVSEVWQVFPKSLAVQIHSEAGSTALDSPQMLTTPLLPDLRLRISELFP